MGRTAEARAIYKHLRHRDVDSKIKESRDGLLLIMQSEHRQLGIKCGCEQPFKPFEAGHNNESAIFYNKLCFF